MVHWCRGRFSLEIAAHVPTWNRKYFLFSLDFSEFKLIPGRSLSMYRGMWIVWADFVENIAAVNENSRWTFLYGLSVL